MNGSNHNLQFNYLYRDAGNYKKYGSVVFSNPDKLSLSAIEAQIKETLIDGEFFEPFKLNIPAIHAYPHSELDHDWYTFEEVQQTEEQATDNRTISEFLNELKGQLEVRVERGF